MRGLLAAISLILLGGGLWMEAGGWVTSSAFRPESPVEERAERFAQTLAANDVAGLYTFFGGDLQSVFGLDELREQWRAVKTARVVRAPVVKGDWAEFVVEIFPEGEAGPSLYLVVFHREEGGWKLFAAEEWERPSESDVSDIARSVKSKLAN
jgi:hypothetical protein